MYRFIIVPAMLVVLNTATAADTTCKSEETKFCKGLKGEALGKCLTAHKTDLSESCQVEMKAEKPKETGSTDPLKGLSPVDKAGAIFNPSMGTSSATK